METGCFPVYTYIIFLEDVSLPERSDGHSYSFRVGLLEFSHQSCLLDSKMDFIGILANYFQLDIFSILRHLGTLGT